MERLEWDLNRRVQILFYDKLNPGVFLSLAGCTIHCPAIHNFSHNFSSLRHYAEFSYLRDPDLILFIWSQTFRNFRDPFAKNFQLTDSSRGGCYLKDVI